MSGIRAKKREDMAHARTSKRDECNVNFKQNVRRTSLVRNNWNGYRLKHLHRLPMVQLGPRVDKLSGTELPRFDQHSRFPMTSQSLILWAAYALEEYANVPLIVYPSLVQGIYPRPL